MIKPPNSPNSNVFDTPGNTIGIATSPTILLQNMKAIIIDEKSARV